MKPNKTMAEAVGVLGFWVTVIVLGIGFAVCVYLAFWSK